MTDQETIDQLTKDLAALQAKHDSVNPPEMGKDDVSVVSAISKSPWGLQHHEIEKDTSFSHEKVKLHISRLMARNFIAAYGGDKEPIRYRIDMAGRIYLDASNLL